MKIGIVSDTHGYFHPELREVFKGVDIIIHAGDIGSQHVMDQLRWIAPVMAVRGNIDGEPFFELPLVDHRVLDGIHFTLTHNAGDILRPKYDLKSRIVNQDTQILISGHYHAYWCVDLPMPDRKVLWLSPGACGNEGHHQERTAIILMTHETRTGNIFKDIDLQKVNLGARSFDEDWR